MGLESLISEDSRSPLQRLRRSQLWRVAEAYNIVYPSGAPKDTMLALIEGAGIDVTKPLPTGERLLEPVQVKHEDGRFSVELFPVEKPHATKDKNIDYDTVIEKRAKQAAPQSREQEAIALIMRLKELGISLDIPAQPKQEAQEAPVLDVPQKPIESMSFKELRAAAKEKGINTFQMGREQILEKLKDGQDAT